MLFRSPELLTPVFKFLDHCIHEYGDFLFIVLVYASVTFLAWFLSRPRTHRPQGLVIVVYPLWTDPKQKSDHDSDLV